MMHHDDTWMRNRNTIEYLGVWESLYNPQFKPLEFDGFKVVIHTKQKRTAYKDSPFLLIMRN